ncbi:MAG: CIA30 family protein [Pseudomonadota bacterium]
MHIQTITWQAMLALLGMTWGMAMAQPSTLLLDDFSSQNGMSKLGTEWVGFTDRVMGGLSDIDAGYIQTDHGPAVKMSGSVRLENNGGFIQLRLPLNARGGNADWSGYASVRLEVRGQPGAYYLHLRTQDNRRPWHYYAAPIDLNDQWQTVEIPLSAFEPQGTRQPLDLTAARSIALVAYGERFEADIELRRLELIGR